MVPGAAMRLHRYLMTRRRFMYVRPLRPFIISMPVLMLVGFIAIVAKQQCSGFARVPRVQSEPIASSVRSTIPIQTVVLLLWKPSTGVSPCSHPSFPAVQLREPRVAWRSRIGGRNGDPFRTLGRSAMDKIEEDHRTSFFGSGKTQFWSPDVYGHIHEHSAGHIERHYPRL